MATLITLYIRLQSAIARVIRERMHTTSHLSPVDTAVALAKVGGDQQLLQGLMRVFQQHGPDQLRKLKTALQAGTAQASERCAHTLRGSLSAIGAVTAYEITTTIETLVREERLQEALALLPSLDAEMARIMEFLVTFAPPSQP